VRCTHSWRPALRREAPIAANHGERLELCASCGAEAARDEKGKIVFYAATGVLLRQREAADAWRKVAA
jgi:hypothetical protein